MKKTPNTQIKLPVAMYGSDRELFELALQATPKKSKPAVAKPKVSFLAMSSTSDPLRK